MVPVSTASGDGSTGTDGPLLLLLLRLRKEEEKKEGGVTPFDNGGAGTSRRRHLMPHLCGIIGTVRRDSRVTVPNSQVSRCRDFLRLGKSQDQGF